MAEDLTHNFLAWLNRRAAQIRARPTKAEAHFLTLLKRTQIHAEHQRVLGRYIVDFFLSNTGVVIEIDGPIHRRPYRREADQLRAAALRQQFGVRIVRISNHELLRGKFTPQRLRALARSEKGSWYRLHPLRSEQPGKVLRRRNGVTVLVQSPDGPGSRSRENARNQPDQRTGKTSAKYVGAKAAATG